MRKSSRDELQALVKQRGTARDTLLKQLRGDLDWVVLKAVQEEPARRYASTAELAVDLERYLHCFPVTARPPSRLHAAKRFVQRHRWESVAALMLVLGLAGAVVVSTRAMLTAEQARQVAEVEAQRSSAMNNFLIETLRSADPRVGGRDTRVVDLLADAADKASSAFADQPLLEANMLETLGYTYAGLGQPAAGEPLLVRALTLRQTEQGGNHPESLNAENQLLETQARYEAIETIGPRFVDLFNRAEAALPATHPLVMTLLNNMAFVNMTLGVARSDAKMLERGVDFARRSLLVREQVLGREAKNTSHARNNLAHGLARLERYGEAEVLYRENLQIQQIAFGQRNHFTLVTRSNLADVLVSQGKLLAAEPLHLEALEGIADLHGEEHPTWLKTALGLINLRQAQNPNHPEIAPLAEKVLALAGDRPEARDSAMIARKLLADLAPPESSPP